MKEEVKRIIKMVEEGKITEDNFREFVFVNPTKLWTDMNPNFFKGTRVEKDVEKLITR